MAESSVILDPDSLPVPGAKWDWVITGLLAALLIFMPFAFGAVEPWSELLVVILAAALSLCLAARALVDREFRVARTWFYLPIVLFLLLVVFQQIQMPAGIVRSIAPANIATKERLLGENFQSDQLITLSFYPRNTAEQLRLAIVFTTIFVVVASVFRTARLIKYLLAIIFAVGCAEAALSLIQIVTGSKGIYWRIPVGQGLATSGSFVNYSNFAQFMNLSLGAGLALTLVRAKEQQRGELQVGPWTSVARKYWAKHSWILVGIVLCGVAVFASLSRNGVISLLIATSVISSVLAVRGKLGWRNWALGALPAAVFAMVLFFGFDFVYNRLATLHQSDAYKSRLDLTSATLKAWRQYPIWGTGFGTYEMVVPMFDESSGPSLAVHADNDYAELLEETGLAGAALVAAFFVGIFFTAARLITSGRSTICYAAYGLTLGLLAIALHSATDFGQRLPANFCLTAAFCGLIVAISRFEKRHRKSRRGQIHFPRSTSPWLHRVGASVSLLGLAIVWTFAGRAAYGAFIADRWNAAALNIDSRAREASAQASDDDYVDLIAAAEKASQSEPKNVNYSYWLSYYRWESISRTIDPESGRLILTPDAVAFTRRIADDLAATRRMCPTFGPPYALEGQLRLFNLQDPKGEELVRKGVALSPYDPPTCLVAGELAARGGRMEEAKSLLARAVALHPDYFEEIAALYVTELKRPELACDLAGDDYNLLSQLVRVLAADNQKSRLLQAVRGKADASLRRRVTSSNATPADVATLARIEFDGGNFDSAIELYQRALGQDYPNVEWRLALARALEKVGSLDEALHEVRICLRLRPHQAEAMGLLEHLTDRAENARSRKE